MKKKRDKGKFFFERIGLDGLVVCSVLDGLFVGWFVAIRDEGWRVEMKGGWKVR
jgi:hypothetical protein